MAFEVIDHTADVGLRITAGSAEALFSEAARGMFSLLVAGPATGPAETRLLRIEAGDMAGLLVDWLRELLYLWHSEGKRFCRVIDWQEAAGAIVARVCVDPYAAGIHEILCEIKAVTYHQIAVATDGDRWTAQVIFDV